MKIQVNTDHNIEGSVDLISVVEAEVQSTLQRFEDRLTRVEVHLGDIDGSNDGNDADIRCLLEARPKGMPPVVVTGFGGTVAEACSDATDKMQSRLETKFGKLEARDSGATIRQNEVR